MNKLVTNIKGKRYGRLLVVEYSHTKDYKAYWLVICDCGTEKIIRSGDLKGGRTRSCGCLHKEVISTHKMTGSRIHRCWNHMKSRCLNKNHEHYKSYGGRGIKICNEWLDFEAFYRDMGDMPKGMTIERINNNGNYEPGNCKWATREEQSNNTRANVVLEHNGLVLTLSEWATKLGIKKATIYFRHHNGWPKEGILNERKVKKGMQGVL